MNTFPTLYTERLILRQPTAPDIPAIVQYAGNENVARTTINIPHPYAEKDAIFWLNMISQGFQSKKHVHFGIYLQATGEFIGAVGLTLNPRFERAVMGYWMAEPFWNQGYTTEAAKAILKFGFEELGLNKIYATHFAENPASGRVMIKNGMIKEGELKDHAKRGEEYKTLLQYRLTKAEYERKLSSNT